MYKLIHPKNKELMIMKGDKFISDSLNEYYDAKDEEEDKYEKDYVEEDKYFPIQSMMIENEWISPEEHKKMKSHDESPFFGNAKINSDERVRFISPLQKPTKKQSPKLSPENSPKSDGFRIEHLHFSN